MAYGSPYSSPFQSPYRSTYEPANGSVSVPVLLIGDSYMAPDGLPQPSYYSWPDYSSNISDKQYNSTSALAGKKLISGVLPNIGTILSTFDAPYVCLGIGANDMIDGASLNDMQRAMMAVINAIVDDGRKLIIGGMAPILGATSVSVTAGEMEIIKAYHAWLESICAEYGFEFVDYYDYLEGSTPDVYDAAKDHDGLNDLLHPNEGSARYMAALWDAAIARSVSAPLVTSVPSYYQQWFTTAVDTRLYSANPPSGHAAAGLSTMSIWVNADAFAAIQSLLHTHYFGTNTVWNRINANASVSAGTFLGLDLTGGSLTAGLKYHILLSIDHDTAGGRDSQLYINDVEVVANDTVMSSDLNFGTAAVLWSFLNNNLGTGGLVGSFSDLWYDDQYLNLDTVENRRYFINADGTAVDVFGTDGSNGSIGQPLVYYGTRSTLAQLNAGTNLGTGGAFTKSGTDFALKF